MADSDNAPVSIASQLGDWRRFHRFQAKALASAFETLVLQGHLLPGDRLPAERSLAGALGVSRTTVVSAYQLMRDTGWAASRQGSGTRLIKGPPGWVPAVRQVPIGNPMHAHRPKTVDLIDLSVSTAAPDAAWLSFSAEVRAMMLNEAAYQPQGLLPLRERVAHRYETLGVPTSPEQILIVNGTQHGLALIAQRYANSSRRLLIEDPTYFGALDIFRSTGTQLVPVAVDAKGPRRMLTAIKAGRGDLAYICPSFHNPTGQSWTKAEQRELALVAKHQNILVIVDDALTDISFRDTQTTPARFAPEAPIVTLGGLSKTLWGGLRVGWLRADAQLIEQLVGDRLLQDLGSSLISGALACELLDQYDSLLNKRLRILRERRDLLVSKLRRHLPDWHFQVPPGGLFLWIRLPIPAYAGTADDFARVAQANGVQVTPGSALSVSQQDAEHIRLSFSLAPPVLVEAVKRLVSSWLQFVSCAIVD